MTLLSSPAAINENGDQRDDESRATSADANDGPNGEPETVLAIAMADRRTGDRLILCSAQSILALALALRGVS